LYFYGQQNVLISQGGTVAVNNGDFFYDAGGAAGNDTNTSYTITLTPAVAGEMVALDFTYFKTMFTGSGEDALFIYDGPTATGNDIGKLMGDYSVKLVVQQLLMVWEEVLQTEQVQMCSNLQSFLPQMLRVV